MPLAEDDPFDRRQFAQPHRAARVELVRGDADLAAQAVFAAVAEARRLAAWARSRSPWFRLKRGIGIVTPPMTMSSSREIGCCD